MNIWLVSGEYPPLRGGVADYSEQLAMRLAAAGHAVTVITRNGVGPFSASSVQWVSSEGPGQTPRSAPTVDAPLVLPIVRSWGFGMWGVLREIVRTDPPDLVHLQYQAAAYDMRLAANLLPWRLRRWGIPMVTTMHDLRVPYLFPKAGPLRRWAIDRLLRDSAAVITTNPDDTAEAGIRMAGSRTLLREIPLAVHIPPGPPPDYNRGEWRTRHGLQDGPVLAHFGMLNHSKGIDVLFQALAKLRGEGVPARLLMVGEEVGASDPENLAYRKRLLEIARELGITDALVWTGYLLPLDLSAALLAADLAVLPFADGASFRRSSLLIVLAHGLPLVTTSSGDVGATRRVGPADIPTLVHGEHCLLVPAGDSEALAAAVRRLWAAPELRERLSDGGRRIAAHFTWDRVLAESVAVYETVLAQEVEP